MFAWRPVLPQNGHVEAHYRWQCIGWSFPGDGVSRRPSQFGSLWSLPLEKKKRKKDVFREPTGRLVAADALATGHSYSGRVWGRRVSLLQYAPLAVGAPLRVDAVVKAHRFADQGPGWAKEPEKQEKKKAASETTPWRNNNLGHAHGKLTKGSGQRVLHSFRQYFLLLVALRRVRKAKERIHPRKFLSCALSFPSLYTSFWSS